MKVFLCVPGRTGLPLPVTGQSQGGWGSNFLFSHIYMCVCVYMAGGAKLPRHPSPVTRHSTLSSRRGLESGYPPCVHIWRGGHSTGRYRSLDSLKPVAARLLTPSRERGFDWNIFYPDFESFTRGFFFLYPSFTYFIRNSSLLSWVFFFFFALPYVPIFYRVYQRSHPSFTYFIQTLSLLFRMPGLTLHSHFLPRLSAVCSG